MPQDSSTPADSSTLNETDRKFFKRKMKKLKRAKQNGDEGKAERIAVEILQYFNMDEDSETPIIDVVENVGFAYKKVTRDT